jgi:hypothetical protein
MDALPIADARGLDATLQCLSCSSERSPTDEQPADTVTLRTSRVSAADSLAGGTRSPVILTDSALIQSLASLPIEHLPAGAIGEANVVSGLSAIRTVGDRSRLLFHEGRFYSLVASDSIAAAFDGLKERIQSVLNGTDGMNLNLLQSLSWYQSSPIIRSLRRL